MLHPNDIIAVGYRPGNEAHLICNDNGLLFIPKEWNVTRGHCGEYHDVEVPLTRPNLLAMRLCGVSSTDVDAMAAKGLRPE